ncbi:MAG: hypothetical protein F6K54_12880 [Okeania sp. SIO3B5]|nr:hypothetical protein [Okeania sp. SIO3B5]NEO53895.1 hypothetical protein [Okeania sp. SIO3B5]
MSNSYDFPEIAIAVFFDDSYSIYLLSNSYDFPEIAIAVFFDDSYSIY